MAGKINTAVTIRNVADHLARALVDSALGTDTLPIMPDARARLGEKRFNIPQGTSIKNRMQLDFNSPNSTQVACIQDAVRLY